MPISATVKKHSSLIIGVIVVFILAYVYEKMKGSGATSPLSNGGFQSALTSAPFSLASAPSSNGSSTSGGYADANQEAAALAIQQSQAQATIANNSAITQAQIQAQLANMQYQNTLALNAQQATNQDSTLQLQSDLANQQLAAQTSAAAKLAQIQNNPFAGCQGFGCVGAGIGVGLKNVPVIGSILKLL